MPQSRPVPPKQSPIVNRNDVSLQAVLDYFHTLAVVDVTNRTLAQEQDRLIKAQAAVQQIDQHQDRLKNLGIPKNVENANTKIERGWSEEDLNQRVSSLYNLVYAFEQAQSQYKSMRFQSQTARASLMRKLLTLIMVVIAFLLIGSRFTGIYIPFFRYDGLTVGIVILIASVFIPRLIFRMPKA